MIVSCLVLRVDGQGQSFDRAQVERRHILSVQCFFLQAAKIKPVGAVNDVDAGYQQYGGLPPVSRRRPMKRPGKSGAH